MPRRTDIHSICLIGSGPIVIGQAAEFDYAGCQALKVLREDGFRTIVINSNPATIMTDAGFADRTYIEPLDLEGVIAVLRRERPDALLPTMGGGTALNLARELSGAGVLEELGIELIGANIDAINRAEDRELFKRAVESCGLRVPTSRIVHSVDELEGVALPAVVRPAFTLGGHGGGFVDTVEQLHRQVERGVFESPIGQVLVEESVRGWDEFELEVVRDHADNVVIVCSIENLDPMGVHTGDSITVAPQMTLPDEAYQELRDAAIAIIRAVGVDTGGSNIQFARDRVGGDIRVIEMNPRVSRSSALASKATGYPIAKVAAKLAVGYTLDEIPNDLTGTTPASFEPTLDYVVVKIPRFAFEKFPNADRTLGTQMKSVGETMGIGRTFVEAFVKAERGLEGPLEWEPENMHPWFVHELAQKDAELARQLAETPVYRRIDSCAGEVHARSNYYYSTWNEQDEAPPSGDAKRVVILGSGPNRIGQGVEFDYCCVHAVQTFRGLDYEAVMINCNPETVSTDYDTSDRLYFDPLDAASVLAVLEREQPEGVVIQFGGQTPLKLARAIEAAGFRILGTPFDAVDLAEDRERFGTLLDELGIRCPQWGIAETGDEATMLAHRIGYPVLVRPSYVLGGRAMRVCHSDDEVRRRIRRRRRADIGRPFPDERDRDRRRRALRRHRHLHRRDDAARRGGRRSLGRLRLRSARAVARRRDLRRDLGHREAPRPGARRHRPAERAARRRRRPGLRARGQPARVADCPVRLQGDRRQPRLGRLPPRRGRAPGRPGPARRAAAEAGEREGGGAAVRAVPRRRPRPRPGDARHRRGDGERRRHADGLREGRARGRAGTAPRGSRLPLGARCRQAGRRARRRRVRRSRLPARRDRRDRGDAARGGARGGGRREGERERRPDGRRPDPPRPLQPRRQHP